MVTHCTDLQLTASRNYDFRRRATGPHLCPITSRLSVGMTTVPLLCHYYAPLCRYYAPLCRYRATTMPLPRHYYAATILNREEIRNAIFSAHPQNPAEIQQFCARSSPIGRKQQAKYRRQPRNYSNCTTADRRSAPRTPSPRIALLSQLPAIHRAIHTTCRPMSSILYIEHRRPDHDPHTALQPERFL